MPVVAEGGAPGQSTQLAIVSLNNEAAQYRVDADGEGTVRDSVQDVEVIREGVDRFVVGGNWTVTQVGGSGNLSVQASRSSAGPEGSAGVVEDESGTRIPPGSMTRAEGLIESVSNVETQTLTESMRSRLQEIRSTLQGFLSRSAPPVPNLDDLEDRIQSIRDEARSLQTRDERTQTEQQRRSRDSVRSTRGETPRIDPVKGQEDSSDGPGPTRVGAQSLLFAVGGGLGLWLLTRG